MPTPWTPILTLAACACVAAAVLWSQEVPPDDCPEGGCRVGYRFEDGGIAPEGWEPYVTDDPVVALMDACLTYFMTGSLDEIEGSRLRNSSPNYQYLSIQDREAGLNVSNYPDTDHGTFACQARYSYSTDRLPEIRAWLDARFSVQSDWHNVRGSIGDNGSQYWSLLLRSDRLAASARFEQRVSLSDEGGFRSQFHLSADYFGPLYGIVSDAEPELTF